MNVARPYFPVDIEQVIRDNPKKASRDGYGRAIVELGALDRQLVCLDADLAGSTRSQKFADKYPERFFNLGIAESNMVSWAAGLAAGGYRPFASTFSIFLSCRAFEAVRQSIAYPKLNVKLVASHGGVTVGPDGASHQTIEDISLMRTLPNMTVIVPSDWTEAYLAVKAAWAHQGPVFIRNGRANLPTIFKDDTPFEIGRASVFRKGRDATILTTGLMLSRALQAADLLKKDGVEVAVGHLATIKPLDREYVIGQARTTGVIVTCEEHSVLGGLGSAVAETVSDAAPCWVERVGMPDTFGKSGDHNELLKYFKFEPADIAAAVQRALKKASQGATVNQTN